MDELTEDWRLSGERLVPDMSSGQVIEAEHLARYRFALPHVAGRRVLDLGCGVGWGSHLLLTEGGAAHVTGVDIFAPAIEYAQERYRGPEYVVADMATVPLPDASIDVVVCFEALEHVHDHDAVLAEIRRLLAPGGVLFVSSPNPGVYPAGNPYHVHEVDPAALLAAVRGVFGSAHVYRQELLIGSALASEGATHVSRIGVADDGTAQYSVVVASDGALPDPVPTVVLTTSDAVTHLDAAAVQLAADRAAIDQRAVALAEEFRRLSAQAEAANAHALALEAHLRDRNEELVRAGETIRTLLAERDDARARLDQALRSIQAAAPAAAPTAAEPLDGVQRAELDRARRERDEAIVALLRSEQQLAMLATPPAAPTEVSAPTPEDVAAALATELSGVYRSRSWRITVPLRRGGDRLRGLRRLRPRRRGGA